MARISKSVRRKVVEESVKPEVADSVAVRAVPTVEPTEPGRGLGAWKWVVLAVALLVAWWWKTGSWPVVAMVGNQVITRYEVEQTLFKQNGQAVIDSLVTQKLVEAELDRLAVVADQAKVDEQLASMKEGLPEGTTWESELAARGFTEPQIRELVELQIRINQAVESQATVSAQEVADFVKQNGAYLTSKTAEDKNKEAEEILKQEKMGSAIEKWIEKVRAEGEAKVRRFGK